MNHDSSQEVATTKAASNWFMNRRRALWLSCTIFGNDVDATF